MQIAFRCPRCQNQNLADNVESAAILACAHCDWSRKTTHNGPSDETPNQCLACGCHDLWRQKDFPQRLGVLLAGMAIVLSTIAAAFYRPVLAIGVLMVFALIDLALYMVMRDVLVCYRCGARFRKTAMQDEHPTFNLETAERYRQEERRLKEASRHGG